MQRPIVPVTIRRYDVLLPKDNGPIVRIPPFFLIILDFATMQKLTL